MPTEGPLLEPRAAVRAVLKRFQALRDALGDDEARKIAAMAEAHHIRLAKHNPLGP